MKKVLFNVWTAVFSRTCFRKLHSLLLRLALRGLGVGNYDARLSGEAWLLSTFLPRLLEGVPRPVFFDVGAHDGMYSRELRRSFPGSRIICFEPGPRTFERLQAVAGQLRLEAIPVAVGAQSGEAMLFDYPEERGASEHATVLKSVIELQHGGESFGTQVPMLTLDEFCRDRQIRHIDFLKIDVEGNELACLEGARELLSTGAIGAIQFEFNNMNLVARVTMSQFYEVLVDFDLYRLLPNGLLKLNQQDPVQSNLFEFQNIIALPRASSRQINPSSSGRGANPGLF